MAEGRGAPGVHQARRGLPPGFYHWL